MSRPFTIVSLSLLAVSLGFAGCKTSTPYTAMYSPGKRSYFVAPPEKKDKAVEALLTATELAPSAPASGLPASLPPADPSAVPGLPPAAAPAADPLAPPPAL